jgi:hypothetical protein
MDANTIRYNILVAIDSLFENAAPGYNDTQMSAIINRAQRRVFRIMAKDFDKNEKVKKTLSPLTKRASTSDSTIVAVADVTITGYKHITTALASDMYRLPSDTGYVTEEYVILEDSLAVKTDPIIVLPISYDYFLKNYNNKYKKPYEKLVWRMDTQVETVATVDYYTSEIIYPNTYSVDKYSISYLRFPANIVVNVSTPASQVSCEINDQSFHDEIVGEAVKIITAALNDTDYQTVAIDKKFDE